MSETLNPRVERKESVDRSPLSRYFFKVQIDFARKVSEVRGISIEESLFTYTTVHSRLFGHPSKGIDPNWQELINGLPENSDDMVDIIYALYLQREEEVTPNPDQVTFCCFSHVYKESRNSFILHFGNHDSEGNLSVDRSEARQNDLVKLSESIKDLDKKDASIRITSWLLSINAFNRLMPPAFVDAVEEVELDAAQDNGIWGQFLDKNGDVKQELVEQLFANLKDGDLTISECFPLRLRTSVVNQKVFFDHYL